MSVSLYAKENGYDMFGDDDDSSDNKASSSEDEIDVILNGTPEQRKKLHKTHRKWVESVERTQLDDTSSSEDEFEKEMDAELTSHVQFLENSRETGSLPGRSSSSRLSDDPKDKGQNTKMAEEFYDDIYFDSDDDEDPESASQNTSKHSKHKVISNDELLYDPTMDDRDQRWVDKQRQRHRSSTKLNKAINSDALLDCPACLTTLCIDCQRHEVHKHQYRAMFVMNCTVDTSETLECPQQDSKAKKKKRRKNGAAENTRNQDRQQSTAAGSRVEDLFHPVRCVECNTVVGVYDCEEVYHFFNVIASHT